MDYDRTWIWLKNTSNDLSNNIKIDNIKLKSNKDSVLFLIDCFPESPIYNEVVDEYIRLEEETRNVIEPLALLEFGSIKDNLRAKNYETATPCCYVFYTIGDKIKEISNNYFEEGNYLEGMIVNAIADDYLFQLDEELKEIIGQICKERNVGVMERLEIQVDMAMEAQKVVLEETKADKILNISVTEGYMFTIVKSNCFVFILSKDVDQMNLKHDCSKCNQINCKLRDLQVEEDINAGSKY